MIQNKISLITRRLAYCQFATEKYEENKTAIKGVFTKNENLRF